MVMARAMPAWRRGFFVRLAATGNATLAAKRAGVARTWVYRWRREDAAFADEWQAALDRFARRMRARARCGADRARAVRLGGAPACDGPLIARRGRGGRPQLAAARDSDWTEDKEAEFFAVLGATLNVTAASQAAGFSSKTAWARLRADAAFARRWDAATEAGAHRLELRLMELAARDIGALASEDAAAADAAAQARPLDPELAKWLLKFRRDGAKARPRGWRRQAPDIEQVRAEIMRKVVAIKKARAQGADAAPCRRSPGCSPSARTASWRCLWRRSGASRRIGPTRPSPNGRIPGSSRPLPTGGPGC